MNQGGASIGVLERAAQPPAQRQHAATAQRHCRDDAAEQRAQCHRVHALNAAQGAQQALARPLAAPLTALAASSKVTCCVPPLLRSCCQGWDQASGMPAETGSWMYLHQVCVVAWVVACSAACVWHALHCGAASGMAADTGSWMYLQCGIGGSIIRGRQCGGLCGRRPGAW